MKKLALFLAGLLSLCCFLSGCDASHQIRVPASAYPVVLGNHTVNRSPRSVGSLSPALTAMLLELGYNDRIVGYAEGEVLPDPEPRTIEIPAVEDSFRWPWEEPPKPEYRVEQPLPRGPLGTALRPDLEAIGTYLPELLFTTLPLTRTDAGLLEEVGIQVLVIPMPKTPEELSRLYLELVAVMDGNLAASTAGQLRVDELSRQLGAVREKVPAERKSVLYVKTLDPMIAAGDTYEGAVLSLVADNAAEGLQGYRPTEDQLAALSPDVILVDDTLDVENILQSKRFAGMPAVENGQVFPVSEALFIDRSLTLYRSADALRTLLYEPVTPLPDDDPTGTE